MKFAIFVAIETKTNQRSLQFPAKPNVFVQPMRLKDLSVLYTWILNTYVFQFIRFGLTGDANNHNPLCVLPLNMINQKYFSFLYVWMGLLVVLTLGIITFRVLMVILPDFRTIVLKSFYGIELKKVTVSYFVHFEEIDMVF